MASEHCKIFLDVPPELNDPAAARYAVLPIPYEATVSYKVGAADGPAAIIDASGQIEYYDAQLAGEFHTAGIATYPAIAPAASPEQQVDRVREAASEILGASKFLLSLGGEHSVTVGLVQAASEACDGELSVLQIDAHADLRDSYGGTRYSHACVMRRVLEVTGRICQVGIRSYSRDEAAQCPQQAGRFITPQIALDDDRWIDRALEMLGEKVYVTVDIDGFDPAVAPGTGTPEPGGLTWRQVTSLLQRVCIEREVIAADIVEVRPIPPNHVTEVLAARLAYKIIAYTQL